MRRQVAALAALALVVAAAPAAFAKPENNVKPEVVYESEGTDHITFPLEFDPDPSDPDNPLILETGPCDFGEGVEYSLTESVKVRDTDFYNRDGSLKWATRHIKGTSVWTGPDGTSVVEHWAWNGRLTETMDEEGILILTFAESGNFWNVHDPGSGDGAILQEKGRHIGTVTLDLGLLPEDPFVSEDFEVIGGPHEVHEDGLGALCAAIAPD